MKFLLQNDVLLDFIFALQKSKEWWDWWKPEENIVEFVDSGCSKDICPVGSLEFCLDYYRDLGINLKPMNVPENLFIYALGAGNGGAKDINIDEFMSELITKASASIKTTRSPEARIWSKGFYLKSESKFKYPGNGIYNSLKEFKNSGYYDSSDKYQITGIVSDTFDEWRYFVYEGKVVGCKCYSQEDQSNPIVPDNSWVLDKISKIDLPAYTLDIAGFNDPCKSPKIVEVHDFFSCGLYGFDDYKILPYMFYRSHLNKFI